MYNYIHWNYLDNLLNMTMPYTEPLKTANSLFPVVVLNFTILILTIVVLRNDVIS